MKNLIITLAFSSLCSASIFAQEQVIPVQSDSDSYALNKNIPEIESYTATDFEKMKSNYSKNPVFNETIDKGIANNDKGASILKKMLSMDFNEATEALGEPEVSSAIYMFYLSQKSESNNTENSH